MRINWLGGCAMLLFAPMAMAQEMAGHDHGSGIYHMLRLETDYGVAHGRGLATWDLDGWIGGDDEKIWLKSEGEHADGNIEDAEFWALYSRNISMFWDAQLGVRYDAQPHSTTYLTFGVNGLAPYYFETKAHVFVSTKGDVSARVREENDFLVTQKLILQPYAEANLFAQDVREQNMGAGLADARLGLQVRYEITRKFAPYMDVNYVSKFGETANMAKRNGEDRGAWIAAAGLRLMF